MNGVMLVMKMENSAIKNISMRGPIYMIMFILWRIAEAVSHHGM